MFKKVIKLLTISLLVFGVFGTAQAALLAVGPVDPANGFPLYYEDTNNLQLQLCLDQNGFCLTEEPNPAAPISFPGNFGPEMFWWAAGAFAAGDGIDSELVLAMEAAFNPEVIADGNQVAFARIRFRVTVPVAGTYTVTHPFGTMTYENVTVLDGINVTQDIGNFLDAGPDGDFTIALDDDPAQAGTVNADGRSIGPFLTRADGNVVVDQESGNTYISNPNNPTTVTGSPFGTNYFRIDGPGGIFAETSSFLLMGKVANCGLDNDAPVARPDFAAVLGAATDILILANDTDDQALNPGSVIIIAAPAKGTAVANSTGTVTYTPAAGAVGVDTFTYTVQDFCGVPSALTVVTVLIEPAETLTAAKAEYRATTGKWSIQGTSTLHEPLARLRGANEVPPVTTTASGYAEVKINATEDAIGYSLLLDNAAASDFTAAHIHVGAAGTNGPPIFFLCGGTAPACTTGTGVVTGSLTEANLVPQAAQGVDTFADALAAIRSGNAYVNVHTTGRPAGEIRGQLGNFITLRAGAAEPLVGSAVVQPGTPKTWKFEGKSKAAPGLEPRTINGESTQGRTVSIPLRLR
jgi:hypothetical protein